MACAARRLLPLCSIPNRMSRDGWAGPNAHIYLPFFGHFFFNGQTYTFPNATIAQDKRPFLGGISKPNTFTKNGHNCGE